MRVSGERFGDKFFPQIAGVGFSFNPYVWHKDIDPRAGVIRLVFGLGTRAVDRADDGLHEAGGAQCSHRAGRKGTSTRCVNTPSTGSITSIWTANRFVSGHFLDLVEEDLGVPVEMVASSDFYNLPSQSPPNYVLTFDGILSNTSFVEDIAQYPQDPGSRLSIPRRHRVCRELSSGRPIQDQLAPVPTASGAGQRKHEVAHGHGSGFAPDHRSHTARLSGLAGW